MKIPILLLFALGLAVSLSAQTSYTWNGTVSTAWSIPSNWTPAGIPGTNDNVKIVSAANNCQLVIGQTIGTLTLTSGTFDLGGATLVVGGATASFNAGTVQNGAINVSNATTTTFGSGTVTMNCAVTVSSATLTVRNTTFQGTTSLTKTGASNDQSQGGDNFNGTTTITNSGSGFLALANANPDRFASAVTFNNTGSASLYMAYNSSGNVFSGPVTFNNNPTAATDIYVSWLSAGTVFSDDITFSQNSGQGIQFCGGNTTASASLAAGKTLNIGSGGFTSGLLSLRQFTQVGATEQTLTLTGSATTYLGPATTFNADITVSSPAIYLNGATYNGASTFTKTGTTGDFSTGGNIFNGVSSITNSGSSYFVLGNNNPDTWNNNVTFTDNGSERLLPCWATTGNQFNGNIFVNSSGSAQGIQFCGGNATATAVLAAGKTIATGSTGLTAGYLYLKQVTQNGTAPISLTGTGSTVVYLGPSSSFGGSVTVTSPDIWVQGATYTAAASFTKTGGGNNHNNQNQNIFNSTCTINQQSSGGWFLLGYNSNDQFNDDIIVSSTGTGGIYLGWSSGTGTPTLAAGKTIAVGAGGFSAGSLRLNGFTQNGTAPINLTFTNTGTALLLARSSVIGGAVTASVPELYLNGASFNSVVKLTKTGDNNDGGTGGNIFNAAATISNSGAGILYLGQNNPDKWNSDAVFTSSGAGYIGIGFNSLNNIFNGNISASSTGSSAGIYFCQNTAASAQMAAGGTITIGSAGFSSGALSLRQFTQAGNAPINLTLSGASTLFQTGPASSIGGNLTVTSPRILVNTSQYAGAVVLTKTGATGEWSPGGNIFNGTLTVNQQGSGYFGFANGNPDIFNDDVYLNNNSTERIIIGANATGNQFNGNIILTQVGSSQGIALGWTTNTNETQAAGKTISIGSAGFSTGYLQLAQFTQTGTAAVNLPLTGASSLTFGPSSSFGGNVVSTSGSLYFNGTVFNGTVNSTKNGGTNDGSTGNNYFNAASVFTDAGAGYLLFGNGNADHFNADATFSNTGSANIYVAYNSVNNVFAGLTTFNNTPTANTLINVSAYSGGTVFSDNIRVSSTSGQGVQFCTGNTTASATLASGKTISVSGAGFTAGTLLLRQFTQTGSTAQNLTLTGTGVLAFGPSSEFGGDVTTVSPALFFNGCSFDGLVASQKNGPSNDPSNGGNIFNGSFTVTNSGAGYFMMGNGSPDLWQSTAVFNNLSTGQHMYIAYNSTGNIFNGDVQFNNLPTSTGLWIYPDNNGINTQFNGNVSVTNVNGGGVYFGSSSGTATLAPGKSISVGIAGFNAGGLILRNFIQTGSGTTQSLTATGSSYIQFGPASSFDAAVSSNSPGLLYNGTVFNGTVSGTKTGSSNDQSQGNNTFNGNSAFVDNGSGYLMMTLNSGDAYNANSSFTQNGTGAVYPNYNNNSNYAANVVVTSPSATAITFGGGTGSATFTGNAGQTISAGSGSAIPVFSQLIIANTGSGVTLANTAINVSKTLTLNAGLLNTSASFMLTMLNNSTTAAGTALSTSYVSGPMRYQKSVSGSTVLNFPIGNSPDCRPVSLTVNHTNGNTYYYTAQLNNASAVALGYSLPATVDIVSGMHYYTIARTNSSGVSQPSLDLSGNQTIQMFYGQNDYVSNGGTLTIVKNTYNNPTKWIDIGATGSIVYAGSGSVTSTSSPTAFNSFSTFALADVFGGGNILPVELTSFTATPVKNQVNLAWTTTSENNNDYFTLEKSSNGTDFAFLSQVKTKAIGGSSQTSLSYTAIDDAPYSGTGYYRLTQTNLDAVKTVFPVQVVRFGGATTITVYPNPTAGVIHISGLPQTMNMVSVKWYDLGGKLLLVQDVTNAGGTATLSPMLGTGIYFMSFQNAPGVIRSQKIIIKK